VRSRRRGLAGPPSLGAAAHLDFDWFGQAVAVSIVQPHAKRLEPAHDRESHRTRRHRAYVHPFEVERSRCDVGDAPAADARDRVCEDKVAHERERLHEQAESQQPTLETACAKTKLRTSASVCMSRRRVAARGAHAGEGRV
jgi:hypothetical protein